ncbi:MAG: hypothetical protein RLZZ116_1091 [Planctomycetota bacterium]|jgi:uncharacterized Tic20 family protein
MVTAPPSSPPTSPDAALRVRLERWRLTPTGRVRDAEATDADRALAATMHLWPLATAVIGPFSPLLPLVVWLAFRRGSPFIDDHGREVLNAQLTLLMLACVPCIGWVALIPWMLVWLVALVAGAVAAAGSELFRYPILLRALR